jgi:carotenoid cleavage dioxygenase-like enzyme
MIFSQTPFPALQKYYIGGHFNHVYVYNTTSGELEAKSVNNIATFDGATSTQGVAYIEKNVEIEEESFIRVYNVCAEFVESGTEVQLCA